MKEVRILIDGNEVRVSAGTTILAAAADREIYIPSLCAHPDLPPVNGLRGKPFVFRGEEQIFAEDPDAVWDGCGLCVVEADGEVVRACATEVTDGMQVVTQSEALVAQRRENLARVLLTHPHACLVCAQAEGCTRTQCSSNVPEDERCCELLGSCELERLAHYVGIPPDLPRYSPRGLPVLDQEPFFIHNTELCIGCLRCVRVCQDLRGVGTLGFVFVDGQPVVGTTVGPTRAESHCRFCGACVEVCPTGALMDRERVVGAEREQRLVPCRSACPAGVDIPRLVRYVAENNPKEASAVLRERVPLAFVASYACFHPCEEACRRGELNAPISVCRLKRFAVDKDGVDWTGKLTPAPPTGKRVAVVGAGPAGLTAAYYLARKGHEVTIFERLPEPGGMMRVGIPEFRYPRELLAKDLAMITAAGVEIRCDHPVDAAELERLESEYSAVFLAIGAQRPLELAVPGRELEGVMWGIEFLRERALGRLPEDFCKGKRVLVVGAGNAAVDAARVALRLDAHSVKIVCLERPEEMPAWSWEIEEAREEGIAFEHCWGPVAFTGTNGTLKGAVFRRCTRVFDHEGRFAPQYDDEDRRTILADRVIIAIGQRPDAEPFQACGLRNGSLLACDPETLQTRRPRIYAGGDAVSGPRSVIEAIAMGRQAASRIDLALGGDGDISERFETSRAAPPPSLAQVEQFARLARAAPLKALPSERTQSFVPIERTFSSEAALAEAARCLSCDLRLEIHPAPLAPKQESLLVLDDATVEAVPAVEGVYQLLDEERNVIAIRGVMNLRDSLQELLDDGAGARYFTYEVEPMFTRRESELLQQYMAEHGELPSGGDDDLDDLF
jgi:NADPH-dependent glutamate synthase beta subunit-like oxidoreductase